MSVSILVVVAYLIKLRLSKGSTDNIKVNLKKTNKKVTPSQHDFRVAETWTQYSSNASSNYCRLSYPRSTHQRLWTY